MAWAPACENFLVTDGCGTLLRFDPVTLVLEQTTIYLEQECDEGDFPVGLVLDGEAPCPPRLSETTTSTTVTTSTSTTSSTSTSTLPTDLIGGARLLLTDGGKPKKRRLEVRSTDVAIGLGDGTGGDDDPVLHGGTLRVVATSGSFDTTYPLTSGWRYVSKGDPDKGYEWHGAGPLQTLVLRKGRVLRIVGKGEGLGHRLFLDPGAVQIVLQLGAHRWCLEFGGTVTVRSPRKFLARDAEAPVACADP